MTDKMAHRRLPSQSVAKLPLFAGGADEAMDALRFLVESQAGVHVHLVNAYTVACASQDQRVGHVLARSSAVNFADGTPLFRIVRNRARLPKSCRPARGPTLFVRAISGGLPKETKHFFLGGTPATLEALEETARGLNPGIEIVGAASPPFRDLTDPEKAGITEAIKKSGAQVVWVGLGTPKQDLEACRISEETGAVTVAVGAAFNFVTGDVREAPRWLQGSGMEWMFRLASEPRRLWRRYLFGNFTFLRVVLRDKL